MDGWTDEQMDGWMDMVTPTFLCDLCGLEFYHQFSDDCVEPEWGAGGAWGLGGSWQWETVSTDLS